MASAQASRVFYLLEEDAVDPRDVGDLSKDDSAQAGGDTDARDQGAAILLRKQIFHVLDL